MTRSGGTAAKAGLVYEAHWTIAHAFVPILRDEADYVELEPANSLNTDGVERDYSGVEYRLVSGETTTVVQCKAVSATPSPATFADILVRLDSLCRDGGSAQLVVTAAADLDSIFYQKRGEIGSTEWEDSLGVGDKDYLRKLREAVGTHKSASLDTILTSVKILVVGRRKIEDEVLEVLTDLFGKERALAALTALFYLVVTRLGERLDRASISAHLDACLLSLGSVSTEEQTQCRDALEVLANIGPELPALSHTWERYPKVNTLWRRVWHSLATPGTGQLRASVSGMNRLRETCEALQAEIKERAEAEEERRRELKKDGSLTNRNFMDARIAEYWQDVAELSLVLNSVRAAEIYLE